MNISDNDWIDQAIQNRKDGLVIIPKRHLESEPERDFWLLERAILVPENTRIVLQNCTLKLSDRCRDNFFRSANCGLGIENPTPLKNIAIVGEGFCELIGADHPRSTGDSSKIMAEPCPKNFNNPSWDAFQNEHAHSYGTDAHNPTESQRGDWRNIGILMANVENLRIENLRIIESHSWAISLEACSHVTLQLLHFESQQMRVIDGIESNIENQDGVDLRNGCFDVTISQISGHTGDDVVALTAIVPPTTQGKAPRLGGQLRSMHVMGSDFSRRKSDIEQVIIRDVHAYPSTGTAMVRLLPCETTIHNIIIENIVDTSPTNHHSRATLLLGEPDTSYGRCLPHSLSDIVVNNVISNAYVAVSLLGYLSYSALNNILNFNPVLRKWEGLEVVQITRPDALHCVQLTNIGTPRPYPNESPRQ